MRTTSARRRSTSADPMRKLHADNVCPSCLPTYTYPSCGPRSICTLPPYALMDQPLIMHMSFRFHYRCNIMLGQTSRKPPCSHMDQTRISGLLIVHIHRGSLLTSNCTWQHRLLYVCPCSTAINNPSGVRTRYTPSLI